MPRKSIFPYRKGDLQVYLNWIKRAHQHIYHHIQHIQIYKQLIPMAQITAYLLNNNINRIDQCVIMVRPQNVCQLTVCDQGVIMSICGKFQLQSVSRGTMCKTYCVVRTHVVDCLIPSMRGVKQSTPVFSGSRNFPLSSLCHWVVNKAGALP